MYYCALKPPRGETGHKKGKRKEIKQKKMENVGRYKKN